MQSQIAGKSNRQSYKYQNKSFHEPHSFSITMDEPYGCPALSSVALQGKNLRAGKELFGGNFTVPGLSAKMH